AIVDSLFADNVHSTVPSETLSPSDTRTPCTTPAIGLGTSIVALSDSSVTIGSSILRKSPGLMNTSITGTPSKPPMSGTRSSTLVTTGGLADGPSPARSPRPRPSLPSASARDAGGVAAGANGGDGRVDTVGA